MGPGQRIDADYKTALKSKDKLSISCLRLLRAALKNKEKELRRGLEEPEELSVLRTAAKQRQEAMDQFEKGGRPELAEREAAELAIIEKYLPAQMDEQAVNSVLDEVFQEVNPTGPKDTGKVMKQAMARLQGLADGKLVNQLVRSRLTR